MRLDQVAQSFIQPHLENLQGWRWQNLFGQPIAAFDCLHIEKGFPCTQLLLFQFMLIVSHPLPMHHCEKLSSIFLMTDLLALQSP